MSGGSFQKENNRAVPLRSPLHRNHHGPSHTICAVDWVLALTLDHMSAAGYMVAP